MTSKSDKPLWIQHMEGSVAQPGAEAWKTSGSTLPLRYHGGQTGYDNLSLPRAKEAGSAGKTGSKAAQSDTASLLSRKSRESERKAGKRLGLILLLVLIAFLLAVGLGVLVYYLLMKETPQPWRDRTLADSSIRILNETYTPDMANTSSTEFSRIADPFCQELDIYFLDSDYGDRYNGCRVIELRDVGAQEGCYCYGQGAGAVEVVYELAFRGRHGDELLSRIPDVIEGKTRKVRAKDALQVVIKHFLVDIRVLWKEPYTGVMADLTLPVYNLTYSNSLQYTNSSDFRSHAVPFCADLEEFLQDSWLGYKYIGCEVTGFGKDPNSITVDLKFRGEEVRELQTALIYIIMTSAPDITEKNVTFKMIGDLLVTPFYVNQSLTPIQIPTTPVPITTTSRPWPGNGVFVREILKVINLNLTNQIRDPTTPDFREIAQPFCTDLGRLYGMSEHEQRYHNCHVHRFKDKPVSIIFTVTFKGTNWKGMGKSVIRVIRRFAPKEDYGGREAYRVGGLLIVLGDSDPALGPTSLHTLVSTVNPTSTVSIWHDGVRLDTYLKLYNLTYTSDLGDPLSLTFKRHESLFCDDLERFYTLSAFSSRYHDCDVTAISPSLILYFNVVFRGSDLRGLQESVRNVIESHARTVQIGTRVYYRVGDLLVLPFNIYVTAVPTNITMATSTVEWGSTSTIQLSSSIYQGPLARVPLSYRLHRFTYTPSIANSSSELFQSYQRAFCRDIAKVASRTPFLDTLYHECRIDVFGSDPSTITFSVIFRTRGSPQLIGITRRAIEEQLPHYNVTGQGNLVFEVMPAGGMLLLLGNSTAPIHVKTVTMVQPTRTVTVEATVPTPSLTVTPGRATIQMTYFLYDFNYTPSLAFPTSGDFRNIQAKLCETLRMIYRRTSALGHVFESCGVKQFGSNPNRITFFVDFMSQYPDVLRQVAIETLHKSEPHVILADYELLPVSDMLFILKDYDVISTSYIMPSTSTIVPTSTLTMSSTVEVTTPKPPKLVTSTHFYYLFNLTLDPELYDPKSDLFKYYQTRFCDGAKELYSRTYLTLAYRNCRINNFTNADIRDPRNNSVTFTLEFDTLVYPQLQGDVIYVIENMSPQRNISGYTVTPIGDLNLILDRFTAKLVDPIRSTTLIWIPSSTYFSIRETTLSLDFTSTQMMSSSVPPVTTPDPRESYILSLFDYGLINFRYYPELADPDSLLYKWYQKLFCNDIESYYRNSMLAAAYRDCRITFFSPDSKNVSFRIWFETPMFPQLQSYIIETLESQAPKLNISTYTVLDVGELYLQWRNFSHRLVAPDPEVTTITWIPPSTTDLIEPTSTAEITTPSVSTTPTPPPSWIKAVFEYGLLNFDYFPELKDPDSMLYRIYQRKFCNDVESFYRNSYLAAAFRQCTITNFSTDGRYITFHFDFDTPMFPKLQSYILEILETAPHLNVSGVTVLDVGDLYLIHRNLSYAIITPDPDVTTITWVAPSTVMTSSTVVPTPSSTVMETSSTTPKPDNWLRAVLRYDLLNFDFYPELKDPNSMLFTIYQRKFCYDIESFYRTSFLAAAYRDCKIRSFGPGSQIEFDIQFETPVFPKLQGYILSVLETQAPRLDISGTLVFDVGDLYLIWGNYSYIIVTPDPDVTTITWVAPSTVVPTSTVQSETTVEMTSSIAPTTPPPNDWVLAIFNYSMFDFTWLPELADRKSLLYKLYEDKFCADIEKFYRPTYLNMAYRGCEITSFGNNTDVIDFRIKFDTPVFPSLQNDILYFLENSAPKFNISTYTVMDVGDIYLIFSNFTYKIVTPEPRITTLFWTPSTTIVPTSTQEVMTSSIITTTPTTTSDPSRDWLHAVFDFKLLDFLYLDQLADPSSMIFQLYQQKFCEDIRRFYSTSYLSLVYRQCRIREFSPDGRINFHVAFESPIFPTLVSDIVTTLYDNAPKRDIRNYHVLDVGDLLLIWKNYTVFIVPPEPISTTLYYTPPVSTPPLTSSSIEPSMTSSIISSSVVTTPFPPAYVMAIFKFGLLNFQYSPLLADREALLFKIYQQKFCDDIRQYYQGSYLSVLLRDCQISEFDSPPDTIKFSIAFETPVFSSLQKDILTVLRKEAPRLNISGYTVLEAGDLLLIWANFSYFLVDPSQSTIHWVHSLTSTFSPTSTITTQATITTTTPPTTTEATYQLKLSFKVLNLTIDDQLRDVTSLEFRRREELFCNDISQLLMSFANKFPDYKYCNFDIFASEPLRINFSLHFIGQQPKEMSEKVVAMIIERAPRENYLDLIGLKMGDMLIAIDNFTVHIHNYSTLPPPPSTTAVVYGCLKDIPNYMKFALEYADALLYNMSLAMFPGNYTADLGDPSSLAFRQTMQDFCDDIERFFGGSFLKGRYYMCRIENIAGGETPRLVLNVIISGTYDFGAALIFDIISSAAARINYAGKTWLKIGDLLVSEDRPGTVQAIPLWSVTTTPSTVTTPLPDSYTILDLSANILGLQYTPDLEVRSSAAFAAYAVPFCQFLGEKFSERNRFPDYFGCRVMSFSDNPFSIRFSLRFRGLQADYYQALVLGLIIEWTRTLEEYKLVVGPLTLDEMSLSVTQRYITDGTVVTPVTSSPITTPFFSPALSTPPTTPAGTRCPPGAFNTIEPHEKACNKFYLCNGGAGMEMTCAPGQILDPVYKMCTTEPPGFVCQL